MSNLTMQQLAAIGTGKPTPPWSLIEITNNFPSLKKSPLSLVGFRDALERSHTLFYLQIRDADFLRTPATLAGFQSAWATAVPSRQTLQNFQQLLSAHGAAITSLSPDWRTITVYGTVPQLSSVSVTSTTVADFVTGLNTIADGAIGAGGVILALGLAPEPGSPALVFGGAIIAGIGVGLKGAIGMYQMTSDTASGDGSGVAVSPAPTSDPNQANTVVGQPPASSSDTSDTPTQPVDVTTAPPPIDIDIGTPIGPISITCPVGPGPSPTCPVVCPGGTFGV